MVQINFAKREVQCKVVYYGPAHSGKTASLRCIHNRVPPQVRGSLTSIATDTARTLYFDFLPLQIGDVAGISAKIHLYSVPYIEHQNALRVLVLEGADGIVFVADSTPGKMDANFEALENLRKNLRQIGRDLADIPLVFQWNKSDDPNATPADDLEIKLNPGGRPCCSTSAEKGKGVLAALKHVTQAVLVDVSRLMAMHPAVAMQKGERAAVPEEAPAEAPPVESDIREPVYTPPWRRGAVPEETSTHSSQLSSLTPVANDTSPKLDLDFELPTETKDESRPRPPALIRNAASTLPEPPAREREPTWSRPIPPEPELEPEPEPEPVRRREPEPAQRGLVRVGGPRPWNEEENIGGGWSEVPEAAGRGDREAAFHPQPSWQIKHHVASAASFAAGALFAVVSLAAIGYLVHQYL